MNYKTVTEWYTNQAVKFEIIRFLKHREMAFLVPSWVKDKEILKRSTRMMKCHSVQHFDYILQTGLRMFERETPYNLYYSLARYKDGIPNQKFNMFERKEINRKWAKNHTDHMTAYDFLIDIDSGSHEDMPYAVESAISLKRYFDKHSVPHEVRFSGKGFHFIIPYVYLPYHSFSVKEPSNLYWFLSKIARRLSDKFSEMIDLTIYDSRRVSKLPYSLALYKDSVYVCTPLLSISDLSDFELERHTPKEFPYEIRGRNTKVFNTDGSIYSMCKDLGVLNG